MNARKRNESAGRDRGDPRVLVGEGEKSRRVVTNPEVLSARILIIAGLAFLIVGIADIASLWWPFGLGDPRWEFGTLTNSFTRIPMPALGLGLILFAVIQRAQVRAWTVRVVAWLVWTATLVLFLLALLYATAVLALLKDAPPELAAAVRGTVVTDAVHVGVYLLAGISLAVVLWRGVKKA